MRADAVRRLVQHDRCAARPRARPGGWCAPSPCAAGTPRTRTGRSGSPLATSAVIAADGPGTTSTGWPASTAARTSRSPGSEMPGMPASVTTATRSPRSSRSSTPAIARTSVWSLTTTSGRRATPGVLEQATGAPGVLAADRVGAPPAPRPRAATGRRGCRWACPPGRAAPVSPSARAGRPPAGSTGRTRRPRPRARSGRWSTGRRHPVAAQADRAQHGEVVVEPGDVDGEAHAERVHRPGRHEQQGAVDRRRGRAGPCGGPRAIVGHLERRQHLPVPEQPAIDQRLRGAATDRSRQTLKRISRTSPSSTS